MRSLSATLPDTANLDSHPNMAANKQGRAELAGLQTGQGTCCCLVFRIGEMASKAQTSGKLLLCKLSRLLRIQLGSVSKVAISNDGRLGFSSGSLGICWLSVKERSIEVSSRLLRGVRVAYFYRENCMGTWSVCYCGWLSLYRLFLIGRLLWRLCRVSSS